MDNKLKGGIVTAALAAGLLVNGAAEDPAALLETPAAAPSSGTVSVSVEDMPDYAVYLEEESLRGMDRLRAWLLRLPTAVRALFLLPLWALGEAAKAAFAVLTAGFATPAGQFLLGLLAEAGILLLLFLGVYKLIFPHTPLKELFSKKRLPWLAAGAVGVTLLDLALGLAWKGWPPVRIVLMTAGGFGTLWLLWCRLCGGLKGPERKRRRLEYTFD